MALQTTFLSGEVLSLFLLLQFCTAVCLSLDHAPAKCCNQ